MPVPPRHPVLTFVFGLAVFALACYSRYWYVDDATGFGPTPQKNLWQVQGRGSMPADGAALDRLVANLKSEGIPRGFRTVNPLSPQRDERAADVAPEKGSPDRPDEPVADIAPLYPIFRGSIEAAAERHPEYIPLAPDAAVRLAQLVLGALTCVLYFAVALRAFGNHYLLALFVGLAAAVYPFWVMNTAELQDGVLVTFLLAWALALGVKVGQKGGVIRSYLFGLLLAAAALTRAALLPFTVVVQLWFFLRCRRVPHGGLCALLTFLGFATGMTPWGLWTTQAHGKPIPVVGTAWYHLWLGNHDSPPALPEELAREVERLPPADRYSALAPHVWSEVERAPFASVKQRIRAVGHVFFGVTLRKGQDVANDVVQKESGDRSQQGWLSQLLLGTLAAVFLFSLLGWRWTYGWRRFSAPLMLAVYWVPLPYLLGDPGSLHSARLPLDGILLILAAVGVLGLIPGLGRRLLAGEDPPTGRS